MNISRDECIKKILTAIKSDAGDQELTDYLSFIVMAQFDCRKELNEVLQKAEDKEGMLASVNKAGRTVYGDGYQYMVHGFGRSVADIYSGHEGEVVKHIQYFNQFLEDNLGVQSFITSGTLLGMVRDGVFMAHDDDIDLAYISQYSAHDDILRERKQLIDLVADQQHMEITEENGVLTIKYEMGDAFFHFDLFTGYVEGEFINIYLQRPNSMKVETILPLKTADFYSEKVNVPQSPEGLLEVNYGPSWRKPDPTFRYDVNEHVQYYRFLLSEHSLSDPKEEFYA